MDFKNKVVILTGGSGGIGEATSLLFSKAGAQLVIVGRNEAKLKAVEAKFTGLKPFLVKADICKDNEAKAVVQKTIEKFGKIDVLVNNAGVYHAGNLMDGSIVSTYDDIMNVNFRAVVVLTSYVAPHLAKTKGNVVNISSVLGFVPTKLPGGHVYAASKAAIIHFTQAAAIEMAPHGVRVNVVSPGPVSTEMIGDKNFTPEIQKHIKQSTLLKKFASPDEIGEAILFLASDKAKSVTGSNFIFDNGFALGQ
ncbi:3-oxoacyl-[acyl-carrier-protein] reductase FabG-like [Aricia agestis]|uniref:3-oxoacyl-[acyl-carrier-protein] reductase FabG-like n=1 Tax=Aricia agestis TaxID=91739 RepID=UPI001C2067D8|nr:3-oxoacyl-[acyl-carrier-protein] reductase FabG-like [Aricia agestis]